jgi:hypothetical protein
VWTSIDCYRDRFIIIIIIIIIIIAVVKSQLVENGISMISKDINNWRDQLLRIDNTRQREETYSKAGREIVFVFPKESWRPNPCYCRRCNRIRMKEFV